MIVTMICVYHVLEELIELKLMDLCVLTVQMIKLMQHQVQLAVLYVSSWCLYTVCSPTYLYLCIVAPHTYTCVL